MTKPTPGSLLLAGMMAIQVAASACLAKPPPGIDLNGSLHQWFDRQVNVLGVPCCQVSDGHMIGDHQWRMTGKGYEVRINGEWYPVNPEAMRDPVLGGENPTGRAIVWYTLSPVKKPIIWCFCPGFEG